MWRKIFVIVGLLRLSLGASLVPCPDSCICELEEEQLKVNCDSFEFINKLIPKQYSAITSLKIVNKSIEQIDPKLKYLRNLEILDLTDNNVQLSSSFPTLPKLKTLNLSKNKLKDISFSSLPSSLEVLDISSNYIAHFPKDWSSLKTLKVLNLVKNPMDCDCDAVTIYKQLKDNNVDIPEAVICHGPKEYVGKFLSSVKCSIHDLMFGDEQEGSGASDIPIENIKNEHVDLLNEESQEDGNVIFNSDTESFDTDDADDEKHPEDELIVAAVKNVNSDVLEEGSGDEGSGDDLIYAVKACHVNCSTPKPVGIDDDPHASPPPSLQEQVKMFGEDLFNLGETTTTTTTPPESELVKETEPLLYNENDKQVELVETNDTVTGEMERASSVPVNNNSSTFYAVVGVILLAIIIIVVYLIQKKNSRNENNRRGNIRENGQEMKPLTKPPMDEKPVIKEMKTPDNTPLISNGNNGNNVDYKPDYIPVTPQYDELDEVELRAKLAPELLTPRRERVTIKETEIPDSVPKTPLLVQRQKNSAGEIIVVPS